MKWFLTHSLWVGLYLVSLNLFGTSTPGCVYSTFDLTHSPACKEHTIHVMDIDPRYIAIEPVKALDRGIGRMSVLQLVLLHRALGGVNGGFFKIGGTYDGRAAGALKIDGWYALPEKPRAAIGWSPGDQSPKIDRLLVELKGIYQGKSFLINGLNRKRKQGEMILFSPLFHHKTLTFSDGEEVIVRHGKIDSIKRLGNATIPPEGYILSIQKSHPYYGTFQEGESLDFHFIPLPQMGMTTSEEWAKCQFIVGGTPILIQKGKKIDDFSPERTRETFLSHKHARTALGILPNGHWLFIAIDRTDSCNGMTMYELQSLMADAFHSTWSINLDGGGSTTMVYGQEIKNDPRGDEDEAKGKKGVRRVSDALLFFQKRSSEISNTSIN